MNKTEIARELHSVPLFSGLSQKELATVAGAAKAVSAEPGEVLAQEGERGVGFFLIHEGVARVVVGGRTRRRLEKGATFGEIALLDGGPRTASVVAETHMELLGVTEWAFKGLLLAHPSITIKLLEQLASRLRTATSAATG